MIYRSSIVLVFAAAAALLSACRVDKVASAQQDSAAALDERALRQFTLTYLNANKAKILGNYGEALELFKESLEINPSSAPAMYEVARIFAENGNLPAALSYAETAWANEPDNIWYGRFLGHLYTQTGKLDKAIEVYQSIVEQFPEDHAAYMALANLLTAQKRYDEALEVYQAMEAQVGPSQEIAMQRQLIQIEQGDYEGALEEINSMIKAHPGELRLLGMKAEIFEQQGKIDEAEALYKKMLSLYPGSGLVLLSLYEIAEKKGAHEEANSYLLQAFAAADLDIDVKVNILLNFLARPKLMEQKEFLLQLGDALETAHPDEAKSYAVQGDLLLNLGEPARAREKFRKAVAIDPNRPPIWQQILTLDSQLNDFERLAKDSQASLELFPQQPIFYLFNGIALLQLKQTEQALESLNAGKELVIDNKPLLAQFYASLGDAYHELGQHQRSDESYDAALLHEPGNAVVLNNYAYYLSLRKENLERAEAMAKKANDLRPDVASFQDTYGWVLYTRENYQNALFWIEQALKNGGNTDPTVLEHYGDVLMKLNRPLEAVEAWKKAIEAGGDRANLQSRIDQLNIRE